MFSMKAGNAGSIGHFEAPGLRRDHFVDGGAGRFGQT